MNESLRCETQWRPRNAAWRVAAVNRKPQGTQTDVVLYRARRRKPLLLRSRPAIRLPSASGKAGESRGVISLWEIIEVLAYAKAFLGCEEDELMPPDTCA